MTEIGGNPVRLVRESPALCPGFTVIGEKTAVASVKESLVEHAAISAWSSSTPPVSRSCASKPVRRSSARK